VIEKGVETIALQPRVVIDHRPVAAQFGHEHLVAQPLRGTQISRAFHPSDAEALGTGRHRKPLLIPLACGLKPHGSGWQRRPARDD